LIDTAALKQSNSLKYAAAISPLVLSQNSIEKEVNRVFDNGLKYDKVLRKTRQSSSSKAALKQLRKERANITSELRDTKERLSADHKEQLQSAVASNSAILSNHNNFNNALGLAMSLVAVAIDLLLFFLMRFICSHEYRSQVEYEGAKELLEKEPVKDYSLPAKEPSKEKVKKEEPVNQVVTPNNIGFARARHGDIKDGCILIELKKGKNKGALKSYSKKELSNLINNSSAARAIELKKLQKKFK
jgi:hypothetical protein